MFIGKRKELKFLQDKYNEKKRSNDRIIRQATCWENGNSQRILQAQTTYFLFLYAKY